MVSKISMNPVQRMKRTLTGQFNHFIKYIPARGFIFRQIFNRNKSTFPDYLSIAIVIKNEGLYIKEWIEYHLLVGVDRFYIYDIESTDNTVDILKPYIESGIVIYKYFPGTDRQIPAYCDAILKYKYQTKWLAFVDADEFIVPVQEYTLPEVLKNYEHYPGIGINYAMYDSNKHITKPEGLVMKNYTNRNTDQTFFPNKHIKSIVNPREVLIVTVHWCFYRFFKWGVDEKGSKVIGAFTENQSIDTLRINHYYTKSKEEFLIKKNKGLKGVLNVKEPEEVITDIEEETYNYPISHEDRIMDKYIEEMERRVDQ